MTTSIDFFSQLQPSPLHFLTSEGSNQIYIKRDDLLPFSFGGNKARKAPYFFQNILQHGHTTVVTYGSKSSNHCRIIANLCAKHQLNCVIISPHSEDNQNFNRQLIQLSGACIVECDVSEVPATIERIMRKLKNSNQQPYFIPGGGHGNLGTQAYVDAYQEISDWQTQHKLIFDYIFLASGTGTTQAGLVTGTLLQQQTTKIIGISVARKSSHGTAVIKKSIQTYLNEFSLSSLIEHSLEPKIHFYDHYVPRQYGQFNPQITEIIRDIYTQHGIALSRTYTGKAYTGMLNYIRSQQLTHRHILFLHTGGVPLFFNDLEDI